ASTYSAISDALLWAWESCMSDAPDEAEGLRKQASRANRALTRLARVFPIAEPASLLHKGTFEALSGRLSRARVLWQRAASVAAARDLPFEEALALAALSRIPDVDDRMEKLERARLLFDRIGSAPARERSLSTLHLPPQWSNAHAR